MNVILIIVTIIILIILFILIKHKIAKQKGGFTTTLSEYFTDKQMNIDELNDYLYFNNIENVYKSNLEYKYGNEIFENLKSFSDKLFNTSIKDYLFSNFDVYAKENKYRKEKNLKTICGGLAESIGYLTYHNIEQVENFAYNKINCTKMFYGGYNITFICFITPYLLSESDNSYEDSFLSIISNPSKSTPTIKSDITKQYALRIKYRHDNLKNDEKYLENYAKVIRNADFETLNYFAVSRFPSFDSNEGNEIFKYQNKECIIQTRWMLMNVYGQFNDKAFDSDKYVKAIQTCSNHLHKLGLSYRDWKLNNFLIKENEDGDWNYVLGDVDFDYLNQENQQNFNFDYPVHSIRFCDLNKNNIIEHLKLNYQNVEEMNIAFDNLLAYLSVILETQEKIDYAIFEDDETFDSLNDILVELDDVNLLNCDFF